MGEGEKEVRGRGERDGKRREGERGEWNSEEREE